MAVEEVKAYIESGILELYVLGQLSVQELNEVEAMAAKYPAIRAEISAIEVAMEAYALENAITPSAGIGDEIIAKISGSAQDQPKTEPKVVPLYEGGSDNKVRNLRFALVACIALLVISSASLLSVYNQLSTTQNQLASLTLERDKFASTVSKLEFTKAGMENRIAMTETTEWKTVKLGGVKNSPDAKMLVYWNKNNKNILINYAAMDLPKTDKTHEYQLWALVDGKPVSLGVFGNDKEAVKQMETIENAQAFAVTIEPMGGSVNPTMESMVVMGTI